MAIIGFIIAFLFSLMIMIGGPIAVVALTAFSGERVWPAVIPFAIGCTLMYFTCAHSPFHIAIS